jgi:CHAT domain-containing protein
MKSLISCLFLGSCTFLFSPSVATAIPEKTPQLTQFSSSTTPQEELLEIVATMERNWESQYRNHLNQDFSTSTVTPQKVEQSLKEAQAITGSRAAFIWINSYPDYLRITISTAQNTENYELPVTRKELRQQVKQFIQAIQTPYLTPDSEYLPPAQQLYQWLIQPIRPSLQLGNIDSLIFCLGKGLRVLPLAALHDGERFLVEDYAVSRLPAFSLTDMEANPLANSDVLAMGASEFENLIALPAVPIELNTISQQIGRGKTFLNQDFTLNTIEKQMQAQSFPIVHFATHAKIEAGELERSYIQLWNEQISLDEFPNLTKQPWWSNVQLLVLSACETAVINPENETLDEGVEMSFAGLALQAGVKAAIASSWDISDHGTLGLMAQFYQELPTAPTKTIALQRAQLALLNQKVRIEGNTLSNLRSDEPLPESLSLNSQQDFSHPYYWATFTVIGNPW